jgi:D-arginine dehydrogenase
MNEAIIPADIAIVGAGMAGASLAAEIGHAASVVLIEGELQPGYHSTGRSAAFWSESYGGAAVQPLTTASRAYLDDHGFLKPRGAIHIADRDGMAAIDALIRDYGDAVRFERLGRDALAAEIGGLREAYVGGLAEPSCCDIDVAGLHAHYLARAKRAGARLLVDTRVHGLAREGGRWRIETTGGTVGAALLVDAAGAWAGAISAMAGAQPIAVTPYRRTMIQLEVDPAAPATMPLVIDATERFYFKPEAGGRIWLSPHDEGESAACDAAPEEIDVAIAIDRFEKVVDWRVVRRERAWAGLRSFAPDRAPVYGFDGRAPGFFWFAGQGGFGIQTAPAAAAIGAALLLGRELPPMARDIDTARYAPSRFG